MKIPKSKAKNAYQLLSEVRALILEEPKRYNQEWWLSKRGEIETYYEEPPKGYPNCGTVGCVAGWVVTLKGRSVMDAYATEFAAAEVLGLDDTQSDELFDASRLLGTTPQTKKHAQAGERHIARFQKEYSKQLKATKV